MHPPQPPRANYGACLRVFARRVYSFLAYVLPGGMSGVICVKEKPLTVGDPTVPVAQHDREQPHKSLQHLNSECELWCETPQACSVTTHRQEITLKTKTAVSNEYKPLRRLPRRHRHPLLPRGLQCARQVSPTGLPDNATASKNTGTQVTKNNPDAAKRNGKCGNMNCPSCKCAS